MADSNKIDGYNSHIATVLRKLLDCSPKTKKKTTNKALADYVGVKQQTVSYWASGSSVPLATHASQIAKYFGVSCDYLVGINDAPTHVENDVKKSTGLTVEAVSILVRKKGKLDESKKNSLDLDFENDKWLSGKLEALSFIIEHGFEEEGLLEALYFYLISDFRLEDGVTFPSLENLKFDTGAPSCATWHDRGKDIPVVYQTSDKLEIRLLDLDKLMSLELRESVLEKINELKATADKIYKRGEG